VQIHTIQIPESAFAHPSDRLHPAKDRLDPSANENAFGVTRVAGGAPVDGRAFAPAGNMRSHVPIPQILDEAVAVATIAGSEDDALGSAQIVHELDSRIDFCRTIG